jgi:hypothetical protein
VAGICACAASVTVPSRIASMARTLALRAAA